MILDPVLAWALTTCFAATGAVSLAALLRSRAWADRGSYLAHLLMSVSMAIMPWPWAMAIPPLLQVLVFTSAALWYAGLAVLLPRTHAGPEGLDHHGRAGYLVYHAAMMAAMVWMAVLMTLLMGGSTSGDDAHMSGMDMGGMDASAGGIAGLWQQPPWAVAVTIAFVAMFATAAARFVVDLVRAPATSPVAAPLSPVSQTLLNLVMALGMGASLLVMG